MSDEIDEALRKIADGEFRLPRDELGRLSFPVVKRCTCIPYGPPHNPACALATNPRPASGTRPETSG